MHNNNIAYHPSVLKTEIIRSLQGSSDSKAVSITLHVCILTVLYVIYTRLSVYCTILFSISVLFCVYFRRPVRCYRKTYVDCNSGERKSE